MGDTSDSERKDTGKQKTQRMRELLRRHDTSTFFLLTFGFSWGWWVVGYTMLATGDLPDALALPGAFGPLVAAAIVTWATGDDVRTWGSQVLKWRVTPRWYLIAVGLPILITVGGIGVTLLAVGATLDPQLLAQRIPLFPVVLIFTLLLGGGQEELGWRGFALPRLQGEYSAFTASLIIGAVWALWHLPLFYMGAPRNQTGSFLLYALLIVAVSILLTWCYNSTGGSVFLAMVFHASINSSGSLLPIQSGVADEWALVIDVTSIIVMWVVVVLVTIWGGTNSLSRDEIPEPAVAGIIQSRA